MQFHDPRGETRVAPDPYTQSLDTSAAPTIGLLANGFPHSVTFLDAIERALGRALPSASFIRYEKPGASVPADESLVTRIAEQCDALVTAYGH